MKTPDILKIIEYKVTGGTALFGHSMDEKLLEKYKLKSEMRSLEYQDDSGKFPDRKYDGDITINGEDVLRVTLRFPDGNGYFRWTDKKFKGLFKELAKRHQYDDNNAYDNVSYTNIFLLEEMLDKIKDVIKTGKCSYEISYPLEIDEEFLKLAALSAEKEGIKVEQWLSQCVTDNQLNYKTKNRI